MRPSSCKACRMRRSMRSSSSGPACWSLVIYSCRNRPINTEEHRVAPNRQPCACQSPTADSLRHAPRSLPALRDPRAPCRCAAARGHHRSDPARPSREAVADLLPEARLPAAGCGRRRAAGRTRSPRRLRERKAGTGRAGLVQGLLQEYALSSQEGVALMCLAEALLRIPDAATRDALIRDKIAQRPVARRTWARAPRCSSTPRPGACWSPASWWPRTARRGCRRRIGRAGRAAAASR